MKSIRFYVLRFTLCVLGFVLLMGCKSETKLMQYSAIYQEQPSTIYIAPLNDYAMRHIMREMDDSLYNASVNTAAMQLYLTAAAPLTVNGYYVPGPLASAQIAASESRTGKQLRSDNINDYYTDLGIDAILFIDLVGWTQTSNAWTVEVEYVLRSTHSNSELMNVHVNATKHLITDYKGNPQPLPEDIEFAEKYGCDLETAQRCRLVETLNNFVLKDLPAGKRARQHKTERYIPSHPEYFYLRIKKDGSVELLNNPEL